MRLSSDAGLGKRMLKEALRTIRANFGFGDVDGGREGKDDGGVGEEGDASEQGDGGAGEGVLRHVLWVCDCVRALLFPAVGAKKLCASLLVYNSNARECLSTLG